MWYLLSLVIWALDWATTSIAISGGAVEGNPVAAHFHEIVGINGYALALFPLLALRAFAASQRHPSFVGRVARPAARFFILLHVVVVANNFVVIALL